MDAILIIAALAALIGGGYLVFRHRAPKFHGLTEHDFLDINQGIANPALEAACQEMLAHVSTLASKALGRALDYTHYHLLDLVQQIVVVDKLPNGAAMATQRVPPNQSGITTITIARWTLLDVVRFQHELLHRLTWDQPELWEQCTQYSGDHWPVIFDPYGSH